MKIRLEKHTMHEALEICPRHHNYEPNYIDHI